MTQIAQGLCFLNEIGVAHRDIKLHNIMVDRQKRAKIIDFGSAVPIIWTEKCKSSDFVAEKDTRLTSTEGYYLPYR
jgi:serine/threonine protein kinase